MGAQAGRDVAIEFAIADEDADSSSLTWYSLGMCRGKTMKTAWDTIDTTADKSPDFTKTSLVSFKTVTFSCDGVTYDDDTYNQKVMRKQSVSPSDDTSNQPKIWIRETHPDGSTYEGPFLITSWQDDNPHDDAGTWSLEATSNGKISYAD